MYKVTCILMPPTSCDIMCHDVAGTWITEWMGVLRKGGCKQEHTSAGESFRALIGHLNYSKRDAADIAGKAWEHAVQQHRLIKVMMEENRTLTRRVMENELRER